MNTWPRQDNLTFALSDRSRHSSEPIREKKFRVVRGAKGASRFQFCRTNARADDQGKIDEHLAYLKRMATDAVVSPALAHRAKVVWHVAWISLEGALPVPAAAAITDGPVEYFWEIGAHQMSVEIPVEGACHWFYRNKTTGEVWGGDNPTDDVLPLRIVRYLERLVASKH
ncbi:hypothetical protein J8F10_25535 [Gemmata sp. G18]|uniref:Uncharacterized protein n=1 Tax=Gemmata palustris TaxID=2822762 RepID=A0ABS5BY51_9BACT|nr:hypothetical protein [Gemmata palustris]MBP3958624.1 hypothetical protein [Gemmata palustris]